METNQSEEIKNNINGDSNNYTIKVNINLNENDGTLSYSENTNSIEYITGFYGITEYSSNKEYFICWKFGNHQNDNWIDGKIALVKNKKLLFKKRIQRPEKCYVSNNGIVVCCDWRNSLKPSRRFFIFNSDGESIFTKKISANLGTCAISEDGRIALFETNYSETPDSNSIFVVDVEQKEVINQFKRIFSFNTAIIETEKKQIKLINYNNIVFEVDFKGQQTNLDEFEQMVMTLGSVYERLSLYADKKDEIKLKDKKYLEILNEAIVDKNASYAFGEDKIYRMLGEYYEANGDYGKTIEFWEKAMEINPKVGIKRKLEALKKKL